MSYRPVMQFDCRFPNEAALQAFVDNDPAVRSGLGLHYELLPMLQALTPA